MVDESTTPPPPKKTTRQLLDERMRAKEQELAEKNRLQEEALAEENRLKELALEKEKQRNEVNPKIKEAAGRVFDTIVADFKAQVKEYRKNPIFRDVVDESANELTATGKKTNPQMMLLKLVTDELKEKLQKDSLERSAVLAFATASGIPEAKRTGEVGKLHEYINSPENKEHNPAALGKRLQAIYTPSVFAPSAKLPVAKPLSPRRSGNEDATPSLIVVDENPSETNAFPVVTDRSETVVASGNETIVMGGSRRGGLGLPDDRTNAEIQSALDKLLSDSKQIQVVTSAALNEKNTDPYGHLHKPQNRVFLQQLKSTAGNVEHALMLKAGEVGDRSAGNVRSGTFAIAVNDTNKEIWKDALDEQTTKLNESLIKSETAEFAISKAPAKTLAKTQRADAMRKTITEKCKMNTDGTPVLTQTVRGLDPLDDALIPPTPLQKLQKIVQPYTKQLVGGAALAAVGVASVVGVRSISNDSGKPDKKPDGKLVAKNNVEENPVQKLPEKKPEVKPVTPEVKPVVPEIEVNPMPPKVEEQDPPPMVVAPKPEEPKKEPPKTVEVPEVVVPKEVMPPKVMPPMGVAEDSPMGKKEHEVRALFEAKHINDFVRANPDVVPRGLVKLYEDGNYKVAENYRVDYMPVEDVTRGVYVIHQPETGHTMIAPVGNIKGKLAIVENTKAKRGLKTFHLSEVSGGKERELPNQLGENKNYRMPEPVQPNKFMTGEMVLTNNLPAIEVGAYYLGGKDEFQDKQRVVGVQSPTILPVFTLSGHPLIVHSGVMVDLRKALLDYTPQGSRSGSGGAGDPSDAYVLPVRNTQEPLICTGTCANALDLGKAEIVAGVKGGLDMPDPKFDGLAILVPIRGGLPSMDQRPPRQRDLTSNADGASLLYILPAKGVSMRVAQGTETPISYAEGTPVTTRQVDRIKKFIAGTEGVLEPQEGKLFTFGEFASQKIYAERALSEIQWARLEPPRAHSRLYKDRLTPGSFGPQIPGLSEKAIATRYFNNALTIMNVAEKEHHTWLDEQKRAAQALHARAIDAKQLILTKNAAAEKFRAAELHRANAGKLDGDDPEKGTLLNQAYDAEAEAAKLLSVPYPDPLGNTDDAKVIAAHGNAVSGARTIMKNLLMKPPEVILQTRVQDLLQKEKDARATMLEAVDDSDPSAMRTPLNRFREQLHDRALALNDYEIGTVVRLFSEKNHMLGDIINAKTDKGATALLSTYLSSMLGKHDLAATLAPGVNNTDNALGELVSAFRDAVRAGDIDRNGFSGTQLAALSRPSDQSIVRG